MECSALDAGGFNPFAVVSNESLRVGGSSFASFRGGGDGSVEARHSYSSGSCSGRVEGPSSAKKQQHGCGRRQQLIPNGWRGRVVLLSTPQELGDRCVKFMKEQRSRLHIIRRCAVMLACWPKYQ